MGLRKDVEQVNPDGLMTASDIDLEEIIQDWIAEQHLSPGHDLAREVTAETERLASRCPPTKGAYRLDQDGIWLVRKHADATRVMRILPAVTLAQRVTKDGGMLVIDRLTPKRSAGAATAGEEGEPWLVKLPSVGVPEAVLMDGGLIENLRTAGINVPAGANAERLAGKFLRAVWRDPRLPIR